MRAELSAQGACDVPVSCSCFCTTPPTLKAVSALLAEYGGGVLTQASWDCQPKGCIWACAIQN